MKTQTDIERALAMMESVDDHPRMRLDELMAHKSIIDFARWVLGRPSRFGSHVFDPEQAKQKQTDTDNTFAE